MKTLKISIRLFTLAVAAGVLLGCAGGTKVRPERMEGPGSITGKYTLIVYIRHSDGLDSEALIDAEGDAYEMKLRTHPNRYTSYPGLTVEKASQMARELISTEQRQVRDFVYRRLSAPSGELIGYELKPIWAPDYHGETRTYLTNFVLERDGRTLRVYFRATDEEKKGTFGGGTGQGQGGQGGF